MIFQHIEPWDKGKSDGKTEWAASLFSIDTDTLENKPGQ